MCPPEPKVPVRVVAGRARTSRVTLFFAGYAVGTVGWVRFGCVSVFSSGFPSPQPLSFLFPSTRTARFRVNGSPARVRIRDDRGDRATDPDTRGAVTLCKNVCKNRSGKGAKVDFDLRTLGD